MGNQVIEYLKKEEIALVTLSSASDTDGLTDGKLRFDNHA